MTEIQTRFKPGELVKIDVTDHWATVIDHQGDVVTIRIIWNSVIIKVPSSEVHR